MCGRFYADERMLKEIWGIVRDADHRPHLPAAGDIHPSDRALILYGKNGMLMAEEMDWGFIPVTGSGLVINARAESAAEKSMFRNSILQRRCVIPASHFYEWNKNKEKVSFKRGDAPVLYMAGFYQRYEGGNRFVILTTAANESMRQVHDRMPVILEKQELEKWVFDDRYIKQVLPRVPAELVREQEYEQQVFSFQ